MSPLRLLLALLALSASLAVVHIAALRFYLYWVIPWLDNVVHFFGGVFIAGAFLWATVLRFKAIPARFAFWTTFLAVVTAGVMWEVFEQWAGIPREKNYVADTMIDLAMDLLGGLAGALFIKRYGAS